MSVSSTIAPIFFVIVADLTDLMPPLKNQKTSKSCFDSDFFPNLIKPLKLSNRQARIFHPF